jgi:hypothetical protein
MNPLISASQPQGGTIPIKAVAVRKFVPLVVSTASSEFKIPAKLYDV